MKKRVILICMVMMCVLSTCGTKATYRNKTDTESTATSGLAQSVYTPSETESKEELTLDKNHAPSSALPTVSQNGMSTKDKYAYLSSFSIVLDENKNYKLLTDTEKTGYAYYVYNNDGEVIDCGYHDYRDCSFSFRDGYLVYHNGGFTITWYERYYDLENSRVSKFFLRPLDTHKNLVAYYRQNSKGETVLAICDMFDNRVYYQEFEREFGVSVWTGGSNGSFSEDGKTFTVTYLLTDHEAKKDTEVTEVITLER